MNSQDRRTYRARSAALATAIGLVFSLDLSAQTALSSFQFADGESQASVALRSNPYALPRASAKPVRAVSPMGGTVHFSENFDTDCSQDPPAPPPSPPAPYPPPLGWIVHNVDNRTPAGSVAYITNAWIVREDFINDVNDCVMFSTSWYTPAGAADDWAVVPTQVTPGTSTQLRWNALAPDPAYRDGYEVRYSTAGTDVADFLANPPLFSVVGEESVWTARTQSLGALAGTPIYVAFRNNSNDKFLLLVDDIVIETLTTFDPALDLIEDVSASAGYARVPFARGFGYEIGANVRNAGTSELTNLIVDADVSADGNVVASASSAPLASLLAGQTDQVSVGSGGYSRMGIWTVDALVSADEGDDVAENSAATATLAEVTETELSRSDWGAVVGTLGIGAEVGGELGQDFTLSQTSTLRGVRYLLQNNDLLPDVPKPDPDGDGIGDYNGYTLEVTVRAWNTLDDEPGDLLHTASVVVPVDAPIGPLVLDFAIPDGLVLEPGRYFIAAVEPTLPEPRTLAVSMTTDRFTLGTTWVNYPGSPFGGWANNEDFGPQFERSYVMSAIFESDFIFVDNFGDPVN